MKQELVIKNKDYEILCKEYQKLYDGSAKIVEKANARIDELWNNWNETYKAYKKLEKELKEIKKK